MPKVYLAGPINGCTTVEAGGWRLEAADKLKAVGFDVFNPFLRDYRGSEDENYVQIVTDDKGDIMASDFIIANCPKPSVGTSMEIFLAWQIGKAAIVIAPKPVSPWIRFHAKVVVDTLDEAIKYLVENADKEWRVV